MIALEKKFKRKFHLHKDIDYADVWNMHFLKPMVYPKGIMEFGEYVVDKQISLVIVRTKESPNIATISMGLTVPNVCESFAEEYLNNAPVKDISFDVDAAFK